MGVYIAGGGGQGFSVMRTRDAQRARAAACRRSQALTRGGHLGQRRHRDEFDRSDFLLLLYVGLGDLPRLRSRRANVLTVALAS
jgi:hypothetical protein